MPTATNQLAPPLAPRLIDRLTALTPGGYHADGPTASEPTAWAALALTAAGEHAAARRACEWLRQTQQVDGSVGVTRDDSTPAWPTSLAMLAWRRHERATREPTFNAALNLAAEWALGTRGKTAPRDPQIGHDTTLVGWSWAADTHSWLEPTALFYRALVEAGYADHPRTVEARRLLVDRLLPTGGANYGNTRVLHQYLLPHVQPSGLVMWALGPEASGDPRIGKTLDYLQGVIRQAAIDRPLGAPSLAFALLGLTAHRRKPPEALALISQTAANADATYPLAILSLAATTLANKQHDTQN